MCIMSISCNFTLFIITSISCNSDTVDLHKYGLSLVNVVTPRQNYLIIMCITSISWPQKIGHMTKSTSGTWEKILSFTNIDPYQRITNFVERILWRDSSLIHLIMGLF